MVKWMFRFLLALNATSWMIVIYGIKEEWAFTWTSSFVTGILLLLIPIILSLISLAILLLGETDSIYGLSECTLADNEFLPVYLGYFFVSLSISNLNTLIFIFLFVLAFTFLNHTLYFNPIFLLFKFHFYRARTEEGTEVFLISRRKVIRNPKEADLSNLKRVNDMTYIELRGLKNESDFCKSSDNDNE